MSLNCRHGGGSRNPHEKHSVSKALLIVSIFLVSVLIPLAGVFGENGTDPKGYTGDEYRVTYKSGGLPSSHKDTSNNGKTNDWTTPQDIVVTYYGVPVAEYNPQFWVVGGTATTYGLINAGVKSNWYEINDYKITEGKETIVFTGWEISKGNVEVSDPVDPGERLDKYCVDRTLTLTAQWDVLKHTGAKAESNWTDGSKYTNIVFVEGETSLEEIGANVPFTVRGDSTTGNSVLKLTKVNEVGDSKTWGLNNRWSGGTYKMVNDLIIDQLSVIGTDSGFGAYVCIGGLYAEGHELLIGTGVISLRNEMNNLNGGLSIYGGFLGDINGTKSINDGIETDVRIFSGEYRTVSGGSMHCNTPNVSTNLTIVEGTVRSSVYGGNVTVMDKKTDVCNTNVLIVGGETIHHNSFGTDKYSLPENKDDKANYVSIMGGCRLGKVETSNVTVSGDAGAFMVNGGGRSGSGSETNYANVVISGCAEVYYLVSGSATDGNPTKDHYPVINTNVSVKDSAVIGKPSQNIIVRGDGSLPGVVFGGGWDTGDNSFDSEGNPNSSSKTSTLSIEGGTIYGSVFGGGYRGCVGDSNRLTETAVTVTVKGGTINGNVYGGGRGGPEPTKFSDERSPTGVSHIYGNIKMEVNGGIIHGSVYGGGQGVQIKDNFQWDGNLRAFKNVGSVFGDVSIHIGNATISRLNVVIEGHLEEIGGDVYCGGRGVNDGNSRDVAQVKGDVKLSIDGGTIQGSVYGGGAYGKLIKDTDVGGAIDGIVMVIGKTNIGGNVFGGGLGVENVQSTDVDKRKININGATIGGSIYGGSRNGDDNYSASSGFSEGKPTATCVINIVSGNIATGTSGNVYGGGYAGHSYFNSTINIGELAVGGSTVTSEIEVHILSVFGGPNVGVRTPGQDAPQLMKGDATVNIDGSGYANFTITGDIFGGGDFCDVVGTRTVEIKNFDQGEEKVQSIQKADSVTITDSKIKLSGNVDGSSLDGSNRMSLNRIEMLTLNFEHSRTEIELDYATRSVSGYYSLYHGSPLSADDTDVSKYNLIKMNNGKTFFILGENENGGVEGIHGNTLFRSDDNTYYGAFVVGDLSGTVDASFWIVKDNKYEPATTTDYKRYSDSSKNDTRAWYISGSFRVEKVVVFDNGKGEQESKLDYILPKISTESGIRYMGHHLELNSPDSMGLVGSLGPSQDSGVCLKFGVRPEGSQGGGYLIFNSGQGTNLIDGATSESIRSDDESSGLNMMMSVSMNPTTTMSGYIGSVVIHFAEMMDYKDDKGRVVSTVALGIFDVKVSVYVKSSVSASTSIVEDVVMRETTDSTWTGTANVYLPALDDSKVGHYKILRISKSGTLSEHVNGSLTIRSVSNEEGKDGWIDANHREALPLGSSLENSVELGTGAVYSPVLEVTYTTQYGGVVFDDVYLIIEIMDDGGGPEQKVTVRLTPEKVVDYTVTFYDKVLDGNGSWYTYNGDGDDNGRVFRELFSIDVEFGKTVRDYYVAYKIPSWSGGTRSDDAWDYLGTIEGYLMSDQVDDGSGDMVSKVLVSIDYQTMVSKAASQSVGGVVYTVGTVEDFLNEIIGNKPTTDFKLSVDQTDPYHYVYKDNNPSWNNGTAGLSRFNFERPITQDQVVYSGYGVEVTLKAIVEGEIRTGLVMPGVIIPVPDGDSGGVTIDAGVLGEHVTVRDGYVKVLDDNGIWKWHQNTPDGAIVNKETPIYSSVTVFVELELKTFHLNVKVSEESEDGGETVGFSVSGKGVVPSTDGYGFNVESSDLKVEVTVVPNGENYHVVDVTGLDRYTVDGMTVHITPQAKDLTVGITVGIRYEVRVDLPSDGYSDNQMFGFDGSGDVVPRGLHNEQVFLVDGTGTLSLKVPSAYAYYGDDRQLTFTLYDGSNNKVYPIPAGGDGQSATVPNVGIGNGTMTISGMTGAGTFHLYIQVEWEIKVQGESGFTYSVQHLSDPLGSEYTSSEGNVVRTGDKVALTLKDGYTFDSTFVHSCAEWDGNESNNSRVYTVLGGGDVVFGKAVLLENGTIVFRFLGDDGSSPLGSFRIYGCARLTSGSVVTDILSGGGTTDSQGRLTFALTGVEPGQEFTVSAGFGGFRLVGKSVTEGDGAVTDYTIAVGNSSTTWTFDLTPCDMTVQFRDGDTLLHEEKAWNVKSSKNVGEIYTDADDYWMWSYGTGLFAKNGEPLDIGMFPQPADGFYTNDAGLVLNAVPYLKDMTPAEYRESVTVILVIGGLNGQHVLNNVVPEIDETLLVGGSSVDVVTDTNGGSPVLIIRGCPDGTGALQVITEKLVVLIVSVPEFEDVS